MEIISDVTQLISHIGTPGVLTTIICFAIIKFNDLRHLEINVKESRIENKQKFAEIKATLDLYSDDINELDKKIEIQNTKIEVLEKRKGK